MTSMSDQTSVIILEGYHLRALRLFADDLEEGSDYVQLSADGISGIVEGLVSDPIKAEAR
jgi:hypothetical protein